MNKKSNTAKNIMNSHCAFSMIEFLLALSIIAITAIITLGVTNMISTSQHDMYVNKYCEIIDGAVTSAVAENRLTSAKNTTLQLLQPYLKGVLVEDEITMTDGVKITGGGESYTIVIPKTNATHVYTISYDQALDCVAGDPGQIDTGVTQYGDNY